MADIKISQLGAAIAVGDTDLLPIVSGGNTLKATAAQVKEHSIGNTNISSIGDGSVTGAINALNTDKQAETLDTPLTIGGASKTTVEAALGGLVSENQTLTNYVKKSSDEYSTSKAYSVGEYCIHDNTLYKCTTACTAGAWSTNQSCFKADTLSNAVSDNLITTEEINVSGYDGTIKESTVTATLKSGYTGYLLKLAANMYNSSHYIHYYGDVNNSTGNIVFIHNLASNTSKIIVKILWKKN